MKRVNNIYDNIVDIKKIKNMYDKRIRLNTKNKVKVERFDQNYTSNLKFIKNKLETKSYKPTKYNVFMIKEPKVRLIMSQNLIDKTINHVVSDEFLIKIFDKTLINENIATRKNKGTLYGIKLVKKYLNELKNDNFYVLKFDISKYFFNIDHDILKTIIRKKIKDKDALNILDKIIDTSDEDYVNKEIRKIKQIEIKKIKKRNNYNEKDIEDIKKMPIYKKGKGLPIGNMSSQAFAIIYLNELDHYVKEVLKIKYYIRYMDDGILFSRSKEELKKALVCIEKIIKKYKLSLNEKTSIVSIKQGFNFLGYNFTINKNDKIIMKVVNSTKKRYRKKMKIMHRLYYEDKISYEELNQIKASYYGHLQMGSTRGLIKKYMDINMGSMDIGNFVKIKDNEIVIIDN